MTEIGIVVFSDVVTFTLSMFAVLFLAGRQWGEISRDVSDLKKDVSQIKGMFTVKLRDEHIER